MGIQDDMVVSLGLHGLARLLRRSPRSLLAMTSLDADDIMIAL